MRNVIIRFLVFFSLLFVLFYTTELLFSGFHMMEDHEIMSNREYFEQNSLADYTDHIFGVSKGRISKGLNLYLFVFSALLGDNFVHWHLLSLVLNALLLTAVSFLYTRMGVGVLVSVFFSFFVLFGSSVEVITRLATIESLALLIFVLLLLESTRIKRRYSLIVILSTLLVVMKENFILLLPSVLIFDLYLNWRTNQAFFEQLIIRRKLLLALSLLPLLCVSGFFLFMKDVGSSEGRYVFTNFDIAELVSISTKYFADWIGSFYAFESPFFLVLLLGFGLFFVVGLRQFHSKLLWLLAFFTFVFLSQYLIFYKLGHSGRYAFVSVFAVYILLIGLSTEFFKVNSKYGRVFLAMIFLASLPMGKASLKRIQAYVDEGKALYHSTALVEDMCEENCSILLVGDKLMNIEMFQALQYYLNYNSSKSLEIGILPLPPDKELFKSKANIYSDDLIMIFESSFIEHYQDLVVEDSQAYNFDFILLIGDHPKLRLVDSLKLMHAEGESWFKLQTFQQ